MEWDNEEVKFRLNYDLQFFAKDGEGGEKTEEPTGKKLKDARNDGKVTKSKELTAAFQLLVLFLVLKIFIGFVGESFLEVFHRVYDGIGEFVASNEGDYSPVVFSALISDTMQKMLVILLPFFVFGVIISFLVSVVQVGWKVTTKPMEPKLSKFNPINGFKRILSKEALFNLLMSIVKIAVIGAIAFFSVRDSAGAIFVMYEMSVKQAVAMVGEIIIDTGIKISLVYMIVGVVDWFYQKHKFHEDMKMTKQEVKDEYKNTEGDPKVKGQIRGKMQEASRRRMMQDVPKADVVITNPTHLAVALRYTEKVDKAPVVVAKGADYLAQKIKDVARESRIPIVEDKPLARALYGTVEIGYEIPPELYGMVAEVLAAIYQGR